MKRLASDEQNVEVPYTGRLDEFGEMAATVQVFKENGDKIRVSKVSLRSAKNARSRKRKMRSKP